MKNNFAKSLITILTALSLVSCVSYRPIFDPNEKYKSAGEDQAKKDADACMKEADDYLKASKKRRIAKEGVRGAGFGAIVGGIFGFLFGGNVKGLAVGIAAGTGIGAVSGAGGVAAEDNLKPDQIKQRYTINCLGKEGYSIIGWE
jgi:uncharacterized protein YcfJ